MVVTAKQLRDRLEDDCWAFAQYILPHYMFGDVHRDMLRDMGDPTRQETAPNRLFLIPRDHLKSVCIAVYATWLVARDPCTTILYISSGEDLGRLQLSFIQNMFESDRFRTLWPDHFIPEAGRREKWTGMALNTDHPLRKKRAIRDETIAVKTIKADKTGRHPDHILYDDLVVPGNAYTELGRAEVRAGAAQAVSLAKTGALMTAVGTVYHPKDQYSVWNGSTYPHYTDDGEYIEDRPLWKTIIKKVEDAGDGTGNFLWPRAFCSELRQAFGWDIKSFARKKAEYFANGEKTQLYAQYYMETAAPDEYRLSYDDFQYMNPRLLTAKGDEWFYAGKLLRIVATMDVATTDAASRNATKADYTAIAVVGIDSEGFYYVLQLEQFQTDQRQVYYDKMIALWARWGFRRAYVEQEAAGRLVAEGLKDLCRENGYSLIIEGKSAARGISKLERHASITIPRYEQKIILHQKGGLSNELENQVVNPRPAHDDLLDAVTMALAELKPAAKNTMTDFYNRSATNVITASSRFGGRA